MGKQNSGQKSAGKDKRGELPSAISAPLFEENVTPEMVNMRLEVERNNNLEKIGDIIIRQNALMKKKGKIEVWGKKKIRPTNLMSYMIGNEKKFKIF